MRVATLALSLLLVSCGNSTVPTPPGTNSPQTTVAITVNTIADADLTAVKTVIGLRDSGKLSQANTTAIENWLGLVAQTDKSIGIILTKPETWDQQKKEILVLLATVTAPTIAGAIDPGAQVVIAQIQTLLNQIKTQVLP